MTGTGRLTRTAAVSLVLASFLFLAASPVGEPGSTTLRAQQPASRAASGGDDPVLHPEGLRMGMPVPEVVAQLTARGYAAVSRGSCRFTKPLPDKAGRMEVTISTLRPEDVQQIGERTMAPAPCAPDSDEFLLSGVTFREMILTRNTTVDPAAELRAITERLGPYALCERLTPLQADHCTWPEPAADRAIRSVRVTLHRNRRDVIIEGEPLTIVPVVPARAGREDVAAAEAQALCQSGRGNQLFQRLTDCGCVAAKVGRAYVRGLVARVEAGILGQYSYNCPSSPEQLSEFFAERCAASFGRIYPSWSAGGGCRCVGEKGAAAYRNDSRSQWPALNAIAASTARECGLQSSDENSVVPEAYRSSAGSSGAAPRTEASDRRRTVAPPRATTSSAAVQPVLVKPPEFPRVDGRVVIEPRSTSNDPIVAVQTRYVNLLLLGAEPQLADEEGADLRLAHQNLAGLTASTRMWTGVSESDRARSEAAFKSGGLKSVLELAKQFAPPQEIVIRRRALLENYDPARQGLPIRLNNDGLDRVSGFSAEDQFGRDTRQGLLLGHFDVIGGAFSAHVRWTNTAGPLVWRVPATEAAAIVARHPLRSGRREMYLATTGRLTALGRDDQNRPTFEGEVLKVEVYWDRALTDKAGSLPQAPQ